MNGFLYGNDKIAELQHREKRQSFQYLDPQMFAPSPFQTNAFVQ